MTEAELKRYFPNASKSTIAVNSEPVAERIRSEKPKPNQRGEGENIPLVQFSESHRFRVTITTFRRRLLDSHDNARQSCKAGVDLLASALGFKEDCDPRLEWCYHQIKSSGPIGTHILIEQL